MVGRDVEPGSVRSALDEGCLHAPLNADLARIEDADVGSTKRSVLEAAVGAEPAVIGAEEHDRRMAWHSHLP